MKNGPYPQNRYDEKAGMQYNFVRREEKGQNRGQKCKVPKSQAAT